MEIHLADGEMGICSWMLMGNVRIQSHRVHGDLMVIYCDLW
jgi:hypothetical protein